MFTECPSILGRYQLAKEASFQAVESGFPLGHSVQEICEAKDAAGVEQVLLNVFTGWPSFSNTILIFKLIKKRFNILGDVTKRELGFAAIPGKEMEFKNSIELTITYAKALKCSK